MDKKEILQIINENPVFWLATAQDNKPHVRAMALYKADDEGLIFHTGNMKDLNKQILDNPNVELCFNDMNKMVQIRVSGKVKNIGDMKLKEEIVNHPTRAFLKPWVEEKGYDMLKVYCVENSRACVWTMETNFEEKEWVDL
jgi:uncharacterized pyridoxamine 5'-phosphate oxidase family protein